MVGKHFLESVLKSPVVSIPWQHQIVENAIPSEIFDTLQSQCEQFLHLQTDGNLKFIFPDEFKNYGITLYDAVYDIGKTILDNANTLTKGLYTNPRSYPSLTVYAHISITPPLPYKFDIHEEGLEKIWSCVTYVTPQQNVGTKMYTTESEDSFVKESKWQPNSTFIFCGKKGVTWHSYESSESTNRITLNYFLMSDKRGKKFI